MNHLTVQQLSAALDGSLNGPSVELVVHHLAHCHACRDRQARIARNDDALRRMLAQDPHDFFLDDLERRVESVLVAIVQGLPVPPMVTSSPLQADEDPLESPEPPLPERPELGRAGAIAQEAGFGRIGLKPTRQAEPPASDPAEAARLLEALERGETPELRDPRTRGPREHLPLDGPTFDPPGWIKQDAAARPADAKPRELPKVQPSPAPLGDTDAQRFMPPAAAQLPPPGPPAAQPRSPWPNSPGRSSDDDLRFMPPAQRASASAASPAAPQPQPPQPTPLPSTTAAGATNDRDASLAAPPTPPGRTERPNVLVQETPWRKSSAAIPRPVLPPALARQNARPAAPIPTEPAPNAMRTPPPASPARAALPASHVKPVTDAYEQVRERPARAVRRVRRTERFAGAWVLATATVGGLLVLVLTLQFLPPADTPGATAWRGFQWQFAPGDSTDDSAPFAPDATLRTATTPVPVDAPVPRVEEPFDAPLTDSTGVAPDSSAAPDSLGAASSR